jgi:hypothetical protein
MEDAHTCEEITRYRLGESALVDKSSLAAKKKLVRRKKNA